MKLVVRTKHAGILFQNDESLSQSAYKELLDNMYRKVKVLTRESKQGELTSQQNQKVDISRKFIDK